MNDNDCYKHNTTNITIKLDQQNFFFVNGGNGSNTIFDLNFTDRQTFSVEQQTGYKHNTTSITIKLDQEIKLIEQNWFLAIHDYLLPTS